MAHDPLGEWVTDVLPYFDVFCDLYLNRRTAKWDLFALYNNKTSERFSIAKAPLALPVSLDYVVFILRYNTGEIAFCFL